MTTRQTPDAVREAIVAAITKADADFGYSYRLTKMDDTGEEHTLFMNGFEPTVFQDRGDGYPVIEQRRNAARTDAILAALDSRAGDAVAYIHSHPDHSTELSRHALTDGDKADGWTETPLYAATPAPAVDAQEAGRPCDTCQGNGEVVTDWDRYMHGQPGDTGDEGTKDCPDCDGTGRVHDTPAVDAVPAGEDSHHD